MYLKNIFFGSMALFAVFILSGCAIGAGAFGGALIGSAIGNSMTNVDLAIPYEDEFYKKFNPEPTKALIYFFKEKSFFKKYTTLKIDNDIEFTLKDNSFTVVTVEPGEHHIHFKHNFIFAKKPELNLFARANEIYFVNDELTQVTSESGRDAVLKSEMVIRPNL